MSETTRTDEAVNDTALENKNHPHTDWVTADFARGLERELNKWESELSSVMPADFKDWWQNSKTEWPEVAKGVIASLRERETFAFSGLDKEQHALVQAYAREAKLREALIEFVEADKAALVEISSLGIGLYEPSDGFKRLHALADQALALPSPPVASAPNHGSLG
jgi:hypothetical protein